MNVQEAVRTVFAVLAKHIAKGQAEKTARVLPEIRTLWPAPLGDRPEVVGRAIYDKERAERALQDSKQHARQRAKESAAS